MVPAFWGCCLTLARMVNSAVEASRVMALSSTESGSRTNRVSPEVRGQRSEVEDGEDGELCCRGEQSDGPLQH